MAKIIGLDGKSQSHLTSGKSPRSVLADLIKALDDGSIEIEDLIVVATVTTKSDPSKVSHPTYDTGLSVAQVIYMLETAKFDIMELMRE